jgi:glycosyltransferase involved in cell wall biosynthesis
VRYYIDVKRILIFSLAYYPRVGGAEVAVREITDRISPDDIAFDMVTLRFDRAQARSERIGNVQVYRISGIGWSRADKLLFQFLAARKARQLHRRNGYSATWAIMAHSAGVPAALFTLRYPRVPMLLTLQEGDPPAYIERLMRPLWPLFSRAFTGADMVQAISNYLGAWARRRGFTGPLAVIPNGVDTARFAAPLSPDAQRALESRLNKKEGGVFLITTSRLVRKNAVDDAIRALALLPQAYSFLILGTGPDEPALRALASREGVGDRVQFLGHVDHQALPAYLHVADIFVRPSRSEGMGNSFIEAMAAGLPVIATQEGGIADFLFDPKRDPDRLPTGRAVDPDSPAQIAEAVLQYGSDPDMRKRIVENARALVGKNYDWQLVANDMRRRVFAKLLRE